jgi:hypothetical protein
MIRDMPGKVKPESPIWTFCLKLPLGPKRKEAAQGRYPRLLPGVSLMGCESIIGDVQNKESAKFG